METKRRHGQEVNTGCIFLQMHFQGVVGAAASGAALLSVIGPLNCSFEYFDILGNILFTLLQRVGGED